MDAIRDQLTSLLEPLQNEKTQSTTAATGPSSLNLRAAPSATSPPSYQTAQDAAYSPSRLAQSGRGKVPPPPPAQTTANTSHVSSAEPRDLVKAMWAFDASGGDDELRMEVDDVIEVTKRVDDNWWKGRNTINGREGMFPSNYVEAVKSSASSAIPATASSTYPPTALATAKEGLTRRWKPPVAKFTSGAMSPPSTQPGPSNQASQHPTSPGANGLQPCVPTEEEKQKQEKMRRLGGRAGTAFVSGAGFGAGAKLASNLF